MEREHNEINIRVATVEDAQQILQIYAPYIEKTAITFEYEVPALEEFRGRILSYFPSYSLFFLFEISKYDIDTSISSLPQNEKSNLNFLYSFQISSLYCAIVLSEEKNPA